MVDSGDVFAHGGVVVWAAGEGSHEQSVRVDDPFGEGGFLCVYVQKSEERVPVLYDHSCDRAVELWELLPIGPSTVKGEQLGIHDKWPFAYDTLAPLEANGREDSKATLSCIGYLIWRRK